MNPPALTLPEGPVPCGGCTLCCRDVFIPMMPGDDASKYQTVPIGPNGHVKLASKPGSTECVYLREGGCSIHDDMPVLCRAFDCRGVATLYPTYTQARKGPYSLVIWRRGRELLKDTGT